jgi:molecular chaperone GrpE
LTPEVVEAVLGDFRAWLRNLPHAEPPPPEPEAGERVDLQTLLGQFVALRHEVHLQTRAARAQQDQTAEAVGVLSDALDALQARGESDPAAAAQTGGDEVRPLLKALVDAHDALGLARREVRRVQDALEGSLREMAEAAETGNGVVRPALSFWPWNWLGRRKSAAPGADLGRVRDLAGRVGRAVDSIATGYAMSLQRIERALAQSGLERMACAGEPFDPEFMEVVEAVGDSGRPPGEVIEEVRPGYLWNGRVFRFAQVRVAKDLTR